jgi:hypothetical protein
MCNLPEVLTALQIKTIMTFKQIQHKEIAGALNISIGYSWQILNCEKKNPAPLKMISDYVKKRLTDVV